MGGRGVQGEEEEEDIGHERRKWSISDHSAPGFPPSRLQGSSPGFSSLRLAVRPDENKSGN
ncbi:hypothetical protein NQZ68_028493 [Dissostichus eleginoides]|nr:hypothetical protein NQZ68_028493 [Dissostichus eleginoides]